METREEASDKSTRGCRASPTHPTSPLPDLISHSGQDLPLRIIFDPSVPPAMRFLVFNSITCLSRKVIDQVRRCSVSENSNPRLFYPSLPFDSPYQTSPLNRLSGDYPWLRSAGSRFHWSLRESASLTGTIGGVFMDFLGLAIRGPTGADLSPT